EHGAHKWWQQLLIRCMFIFFRTICHIQSDELVDTQPFFKESKMTLLNERRFFHRMIFSRVYQKQAP
ncbi:MAG TPA: hypothetical protein VK750_00090, partial [Cytophagaceae bacterium]|nr:hypothetical protein [Cytophagaceae bacterium]